MGTQSHSDAFGAYALPPTRERLRAKADTCANTRMGRWRISYLRKRAIRGLSEPFDVTVAPGVKARLHPSGNRCEKRALAGVQVWDWDEREALRLAVQASPNSEPYVFLDVGANAGLYSLFVHAYAKTSDRSARIIAVEPSPTMSARLSFNAHASNTNIERIRSAISDAPGEARISDGGGNRGEATLGQDGDLVPVETLIGLCQRLNVTHIDAMKVDIEGHDERALCAFFRDAPETLHPRLLILELSAQSRTPLVELARTQNYVMSDDTALNAIFKKSDYVQT